VLYPLSSTFPSKNPPSKKSSAFVFLNLTLRNKKVEETAVNQWATLRVARENFSDNELSFVLAHLYGAARTFFVEKQG
jgi:hypothetical protein